MENSDMQVRMTITDAGKPILFLLCPESLEEQAFIDALSVALETRKQMVELKADLAELEELTGMTDSEEVKP